MAIAHRNNPIAELISRAKIKPVLNSLLIGKDKPPEIALGVSIGVMIAVMPLYGLHTILCLIFALLIPRANKIAIFIGTNVSLPPTVPFITWAGYGIGRFFLGKQYPSLSLATFKEMPFKDIFSLYYPLFVGSFMLGTLLAIMFYFLTLWIIEKRRKAKKAYKSCVTATECRQ